MARDYARKQGFKGTFLIEPKPCEPSKHQYDFDSETVIGFLREFGLDKDFQLNIEANHATLSGHTFAHELQVAADAGMLGSIDANRGDEQNGWDTDQFPVNLQELAEVMLVILRAGGFKTGGVNFDAKTRRNSTDLEDIFHAHIGGMDAFARALLIADRILADGVLDGFVRGRYASFDTGAGKDFENGKLSLDDLYAHGLAMGEPELAQRPPGVAREPDIQCRPVSCPDVDGAPGSVVARPPIQSGGRVPYSHEWMPADYFRRATAAEIFPDRPDAPIEVDLGCGDGTFLASMGAHFPERNFLGIERLLGRVKGTCRRAGAAGCANVRVLRLESEYSVGWLLPLGCCLPSAPPVSGPMAEEKTPSPPFVQA